MNPELAEVFAFQGRVCRGFGSAIYGELFRRCAADLADPGSPLYRVLDDWDGDARRDFVQLRLMGGVHALVLSGRAPALAAHYPSAGGAPRFPACWDAFRETLEEHRETLRAALERVPQTNEVRRSATLLGGFLEIARRFGRPLRLRELGASAGLNLFWSQYRYELGPHRWGARDAELVLACDWQGPPPALEAGVCIESRAGCDRHPIDVGDRDARIGLESFFWPDQVERLERLRAAAAHWTRDPPRLDRAEAGDWLAAELAAGWPAGVCLVVYHSSFWIYLDPADQASIRASLERAGAGATASHPLAWLRAEDEGPTLSLRLTTWPRGEDQRLANVHPHGEWIHWRGVQNAHLTGGAP